MDPLLKFKKLNKYFSPRGFAVFDISRNQLAIAKDFDGKVVLLDDDCAKIHRTFNTDQWTQRFNELEDDTIWDDLDPIEEYNVGKYVANRESLPFLQGRTLERNREDHARVSPYSFRRRGTGT